MTACRTVQNSKNRSLVHDRVDSTSTVQGTVQVEPLLLVEAWDDEVSLFIFYDDHMKHEMKK